MTIPPIPVENGQPLEACVTTDADGAWRVAWCHDGGRIKELFGEPMDLRVALRVAAAINERVWA